MKETFQLKDLKCERNTPRNTPVVFSSIQAQEKQIEKVYQITNSNQKEEKEEKKFNMRIRNANKVIFEVNKRINPAKDSKNKNDPSELRE